ncbi:MAG: hypothetical protein L0177_06190 [Chloroflexi bacterium]|nr:hypothetical protein [Chloroflexota bacterium]
MPRRRIQPKGRRFEGLSALPIGEMNHWESSGPVVQPGATLRAVGRKHVVWPSWAEWAETYAECRDEFLEKKRPKGARPPIAEALYQAFVNGEDIDDVLAELQEEREADDPRYQLGVEGVASA